MNELFSKDRKRSGRGVERVSHFFLSGTNFSESQQKKKPIDSSADTASVPLPIKKQVPRIGDNKDASTALSSNLFIILSSDRHIVQGTFLGCMLALSLAGNDIRVGLIETTVRLPHTFFLSGGYKNLNALFWEASIDAPEFSSVVARIQKTCDVVFLNFASSSFGSLDGFSIPIGKCLVPTTVRSKDLIHTYGVIRSGAQKNAIKEFDLIVFQDRSSDKAAGAARVMEEMAQRFLSCSIRFLGAIPMGKDVIPDHADLSSASFKGLPRAVTASIDEIAYELIKKDNHKEAFSENIDEEDIASRHQLTQIEMDAFNRLHEFYMK